QGGGFGLEMEERVPTGLSPPRQLSLIHNVICEPPQLDFLKINCDSNIFEEGQVARHLELYVYASNLGCSKRLAPSLLQRALAFTPP
ncbi:hypothetical protein S83_063298, partial [Arachis hypogaea]